MFKISKVFALFCVLALPLAGCKKKPGAGTGSGTSAKPAPKKKVLFGGIDKDSLTNFKPLPKSFASKTNPITEDKVALGRMLYYDTRLSRSQKISCNTCHMLDKFGAEPKAVSDGHAGQKGGRNSPTVYNAAGHFRQFWDGRAKDVEEQAKGPVLNPIEMAMKSETDVVKVLESIPGYKPLFAKAFPKSKDPITYDNMAKAIGAFERGLVTPSRWDKFLAGDPKALTPAEKAGFKAFVKVGCPTCHSGVLLGGHIYQKLGLVKPWPNKKDQGRWEVTKKDEDKMMFKVPSLRNVTKTGPYFHDGSEKDLSEVVRKMAWHQFGQKLDAATIKSIVTFLGALTGDVPGDYVNKPELPKSGKTTPKPDDSVDKKPAAKGGDDKGSDKKDSDKKDKSKAPAKKGAKKAPAKKRAAKK